jgi:hypothetical protein
VQQPDHPGAGHPRAHLQAQSPQAFLDERGRARLLAAELGVAVQVAAHRLQLGSQSPRFHQEVDVRGAVHS